LKPAGCRVIDGLGIRAERTAWGILPVHRVLCRLFGHRRSRRRARRSGNGWRSRCRLCGTPMIRVAKGVWQVDAKLPEGRWSDRRIARQGRQAGL